MLDIIKGMREITLTFTSELHLVDEVLRSVKSFMKEAGARDMSSVKVITRELLINAIEHGNKNIADLKVTCSIEQLKEQRFKIVVEDDGEGFDHEKLEMSLCDDPRQERNRGYILINSLADEVRFEDKGRKITAFASSDGSTTFQITGKDDFKVIIPSGSITATCGDKFRGVLLELVNAGNHKIRFDFKYVEDIDSVGLSVLVALANTISEKTESSELEIINLSSECAELFRIIRLDTIFRISTIL